jgi:hypothetical protein
MHWTHHVAHDFDASRHFIAAQVHPGVWFGNIVAGVFVFVVVDICWQLWLKKPVERWFEKRHENSLAKHHRDVVEPLMTAQHLQVLAQAEQHHREHMDRLPPKRVAKKAVKKVAKKSPPTKRAKR